MPKSLEIDGALPAVWTSARLDFVFDLVLMVSAPQPDAWGVVWRADEFNARGLQRFLDRQNSLHVLALRYAHCRLYPTYG